MASNAVRIASLVIVVLLVLAILGVSIAVLVTVLNIQHENSANGGVPKAPVISAGDVRYPAFKQVDEKLKSWMDTKVNPCNDFYNYACKKGNTADLVDPFSQSQSQNDELQLTKYKDPKYFENAPTPLKQLKYYFDKCVSPDATADEANPVIVQYVERLKAEAGVAFPMIYQDETVDALTAEQLSKLIGFAMNDVGEATLVTIELDQDWKQPDAVPARVFVDEPSLPYSYSVYENWHNNRDNAIASIVSLSNSTASALGKTLDADKLQSDASAVADLDYALYGYVSKASRYEYATLYHKLKLSNVQTSAAAFNWIELIKAALTRAEAEDKIDEGLEVVVLFPDSLIKLSNDIAANKYTASTLSNYIQYRAMLATRSILPDIPNSSVKSMNTIAITGTTKQLLRTKKRRRMGLPSNIRRIPTPKDESRTFQHLSAKFTGQEYNCFREVKSNMVEASDRVFVDAAYPTPQSRTDIRNEVSELAAWIFSGFRTQIDMLDWMSDESKKGAYGKLDNIQLSIAYPDWVTDDAKLSDFYNGLTFTATSKSMDIYIGLAEFLLTKSVVNFRLQAPRDRGDFLVNVGITNAFYNPPENAMIMPGGILNQPFYDPYYPAAVKFGSIMYVVGHELTHGFDDQGVQYDGIGALNSWMDDDSQSSFDKMADCVINEYSTFCPLPAGKPCVNGEQTQGENIADNGGIQAAYKAFKTYESFYGPDPRLPSFGKVFNSDQLFFLSFAQSWCGSDDPTYVEYLIESDTHSPDIDRVWGTLQNFPAFRSAFNCPVGSAYAPASHCNVWTSAPALPKPTTST